MRHSCRRRRKTAGIRPAARPRERPPLLRPRAAALTLLTPLLLAFGPRAATAQEVVLEPYQLIQIGVGYASTAPTADLGAEALDGGGAALFTAGVDMHQGGPLWLYGRVEADLADVRQHLVVAGGGRYEFLRRPGWRPYGAVGAGVVILEPRRDLAGLDRAFTLRGEAAAGVLLTTMPGLRWFAEYRLGGARFEAIVEREPGCSINECGGEIRDKTLHLTHAVTVGVRIEVQ
jgi:hypothetical protein